MANPPSPAAPGTPQTYTLTGLTPGQSYYVAVVAVDDSRHRVMSNVVDTFTAGILVPPARFTDLDTANASAILSCPTVESYYDELVYEFELDVDSLFRSARYAGVTPEDAQIGVTFDQLDPDSIYYWHCRVVSLAPADSSDWTSYSAFNLLTGLLTGGEDTEDVPPSVFAYPNPVSFAQGDVLTFRLPAYPVDLMIRNSGSADRVLLRSGVSGEWEWDGRNDSGHPVTPGIYSWFIVGWGNRFDGKIMVQP